ncbi:MAG: hypothetical protein JWO08_1174 [Verrucomicrobiaceae bacterium]|nr:hypothetical protein [Verrucomicrobiaceae bacterium]
MSTATPASLILVGGPSCGLHAFPADPSADFAVIYYPGTPNEARAVYRPQPDGTARYLHDEGKQKQ